MTNETSRDVLAEILRQTEAAGFSPSYTPDRIRAAIAADKRLVEAARRVAAARDAMDDAEPGSDHRNRCVRKMHAAIDRLAALAGEDEDGL